MRRPTATGTQSMVATQHPLAVDAAMDMLAAGGTAADAAVAAAAVLTVVDPASTSLGGDVFALYWETGAARPVALHSSGFAPAGLTVDAVRAAGHSTMPVEGPWTITVPGAPAGWSALLDRFGRLDVARILAPAIAHARDGFSVTPAVAAEWTQEVDKLRRNTAGAATFLLDGRAPREGERFAVSDLAATLEHFVQEGHEPFYRGDIAQRIAAAVAELGGPMRTEDLAAWSGPQWIEPITASFRGLDVYEVPPPVQSVVVLEALRIYEGLATAGAVEEDHAAIEAIKLAYDDANRYVADPAFEPVPIDELLSNDHIREQSDRISPNAVLTGDVGLPTDTVYVAVADRHGGSCSFIYSIYNGFGSGVVVPGTGLTLHNRGAGFRLDDTHPNRPQPHKRPLHTIMPAMLGKDGDFHGCLGVVGGYMQPQGQVQVLRNLLDRGMTPQDAVDAPRFRVFKGKEVALEEGYDPRTAEGLRERGHHVTTLNRFERGGAQLIVRDEHGYHGGSDSRKDGHAAGR